MYRIHQDELDHLFDGFELPLSRKKFKRYLKADREFHEKLIALSSNALLISMDNNFDFILKSYQKAQELCILHQLRSRDVIQEKHLRFTQ